MSPHFRRVLRLVPGYVGVEALTEQGLRTVATLDLRIPAVLSLVTERFPITYERRSRSPNEHLERLNWVRDKFLLCAYTGLRLSDADRLALEHVQGDLLCMRAGKTDVICCVPPVNDAVFKPQAYWLSTRRWAWPPTYPGCAPPRNTYPWCRSWPASCACT